MKIIDAKPQRPTHAEIATRAYELFVQRGRVHGFDLADWLQAEGELMRSDSPKLSVPVKTAQRSSAPRLKKTALH